MAKATGGKSQQAAALPCNATHSHTQALRCSRALACLQLSAPACSRLTCRLQRRSGCLTFRSELISAAVQSAACMLTHASHATRSSACCHSLRPLLTCHLLLCGSLQLRQSTQLPPHSRTAAHSLTVRIHPLPSHSHTPALSRRSTPISSHHAVTALSDALPSVASVAGSSVRLSFCSFCSRLSDVRSHPPGDASDATHRMDG